MVSNGNRRPGPTAQWDLTTPAYLILGMLRLGARSGYDVKRMADSSARYFAAVSHVQIYPLLKDLERAGLVEGNAEARGRRRRRAYELTPEGEAALVEWLRREDELGLDVRDLGLLKLFFAEVLDWQDTLELVRQIRARSERILAELRQRKPATLELRARGESSPDHALGFGLAMHEAWIAHCDMLEAELRENAPGVRRKAS